MSEPAAFSPVPASPPRREWVGVLLLLGAFLLFNLCTYNNYPQVWVDEVWFSEPPVNRVLEGEFHARTFKYQPPHTFPTVNCPLYMMAQVPWLSVMGTSVLAIRSFNYTLMAFAAFLVWLVSWRFGLIKSTAGRLLFLVVLHLGYGMCFAYRCSRPDILGMTSLLLLTLSFSLSSPGWRFGAMFLFSVMTFWVGLQVAFFAAFACGMAWLILRKVKFREVVVVAAGLITGVVSLLLFLIAVKALVNFLPQMGGMMGKRYAHATIPISVKLHKVIDDVLHSYIDDFSTDFVFLGLILLVVIGWRHLSLSTRRLVFFSLILVFGAPLLFDVAGHWAFYYSYLRYIPITFALFVVLAELMPFVKRAKLIGVATILCAVAVGLPMRLAISMLSSRTVPRAELVETFRSKITPDDIVLSDHAPFFEVKKAALVVFDPTYDKTLAPMSMAGGHDFTEAEKQAFTVMVIRPPYADVMTNYIGGHWAAVTEPFGDRQDFSLLSKLPVVGKRLTHYAVQPQTERYPVQIFRRVAEGSLTNSPDPAAH